MDGTNSNLKLSEETSQILKEETLANIQAYAKHVDDLRNKIKSLDNAVEIFDQQLIDTKEIKHIRTVHEYSLLLGLIWLDISTAYRIYFQAKEGYELLYSIKQLIITINEGYKSIYHFITTSNGVQKTTKRNNSFWVKEIGLFIKEELPNLQEEYSSISQDLDKYIDDEIEVMKGQRDVFVHYANNQSNNEKNPSEVYDMLINLDIEKITIKTMSFMKIVTRMFEFSKKALAEYNLLITERRDAFYRMQLDKIEELKLCFVNNAELKNELTTIQQQLLDLKTARFES